MKKRAFQFTLAATATFAVLALSSTKAASLPEPALVNPGDTFSFDIVVFNNTTGTAAYAVSPIDTTFGTTTTYTGVGLGGSNVTITSSESVGVSTTTDTVTVSTPSNFAPTGYKIGTASIQGVEFDIDQDTTFADPISLALPISSDTSAGTATYLVTDTFTEAPVTTLVSGGSGIAMYEGIGVGSGSINADKVSAFSYSVTYATVTIPEPSTMALSALGLIACGVVAVRSRRRTA